MNVSIGTVRSTRRSSKNGHTVRRRSLLSVISTDRERCNITNRVTRSFRCQSRHRSMTWRRRVSRSSAIRIPWTCHRTRRPWKSSNSSSRQTTTSRASTITARSMRWTAAMGTVRAIWRRALASWTSRAAREPIGFLRQRGRWWTQRAFRWVFQEEFSSSNCGFYCMFYCLLGSECWGGK